MKLDYTTYANGPYCPRCHKSRPEAMLCGAARCLICWAKDRARAEVDAPGCVIDTDHFTCEFHVFFLSLEETPEMLERLARGEGAAAPAHPARSKIGASPLAAITPVDRVAARVTRDAQS